MYGTALLVSLVALMGSTAHADTTFIKPPPDGRAGDYDTNPRYTSGKPIEIIFRTDLDKMDVAAVQDYPTQNGVHGGVSVDIAKDTQMTTFSWTPNRDDWDTDGDEDIVLYIGVFSNGGRDGASHYFNVSVADANSKPSSAAPSSSTFITTTSSAPSSSSASGESKPTTSSSSASASESSSAEEGTNKNSDDQTGSSAGLTTGAKAGIAVGVTLGVLAIIAGIGLLVWRRKKANKDRVIPVQELPASDVGPEGYYAPSSVAKSSPAGTSPTSPPQMQHAPHNPNVIHEAP